MSALEKAVKERLAELKNELGLTYSEIDYFQSKVEEASRNLQNEKDKAKVLKEEISELEAWQQ